MLCSNCGSPRTRYVKSISRETNSFSNENQVQKKTESVDLYRCTTCGSSFEFRRA